MLNFNGECFLRSDLSGLRGASILHTGRDAADFDRMLRKEHALQHV